MEWHTIQTNPLSNSRDDKEMHFEVVGIPRISCSNGADVSSKTSLSLDPVLTKYVSTGVHTFGRTFTLPMYGVLYQCDSGYAGMRGGTWMLMTCINQLLHACLI